MAVGFRLSRLSWLLASVAFGFRGFLAFGFRGFRGFWLLWLLAFMAFVASGFCVPFGFRGFYGFWIVCGFWLSRLLWLLDSWLSWLSSLCEGKKEGSKDEGCGLLLLAFEGPI